MRHRSRIATSAIVLAALLPWSLFAAAPARADANEACASAAEAAQALRGKKALVSAREKLLSCSREECPVVVRRFCLGWLTEIDSALPSIVVRAHDARERDVLGVQVVVDGRVLIEALDGSAVAVDPGPHHLTFKSRGGDVLDEDVLIAEGERNRVLSVAFPARLRADGMRDTPDRETAGTPTHSATGATDAPGPRTSPPTLAYVFGGVGIAGIGAFTALDLVAWHDYRALRDGCGTTQSCATSDVDAVRTKFVLAGVSLAVGVVGLGVATWMWLSAPRDHRASVARSPIDLRPVAGGAVAEWRAALY